MDAGSRRDTANGPFNIYALCGSEGVPVNWDFCKTVERNQIG